MASKPTHLLIPIEYLNRRIDGLTRQVETMDGDLIKELRKLLNNCKQISINEDDIEAKADDVFPYARNKYEGYKQALKDLLK